MTLPEVMWAAAILLICLVALATLLAGAINSSQVSRIRDEAANLANARIEAARSLPYDNVGVRYENGLAGDPPGVILTPEQVGNFTVETSCTWVRGTNGRAEYKKFGVRVSWAAPLPGNVVVNTLIYGKSTVAGTGDMVVKLRYRETGLPVINASVAEIDSGGSSRGVMSDGQGEAFFGQLPSGPVALTVTPPAGYLVDSTSLADAAVTGDSLSTLIVYIQRPATTTIRVRDDARVAIPGATVVVRRDDGVSTTHTTDTEGYVVLTDLLYADYSVSAAANGYASATLPMTLNAAAPGGSVRFRLAPSTTTGGLVVSVRDANGTPLRSAYVYVDPDGNGSYAWATTGTDGSVTFPTLAPGTYRLLVDKAGYEPDQQMVEVLAGGTAVAVTMQGAQAGSIQVTTLDKNGHAASLRFIVSGTGYFRDDLVSNVDGVATITDLPVGQYSVSCYTSPASVATVIVADAQTAVVTINQAKK